MPTPPSSRKFDGSVYPILGRVSENAISCDRGSPVVMCQRHLLDANESLFIA